METVSEGSIKVTHIDDNVSNVYEPAVALCIVTCRRPDGLRRLLLALNSLKFREWCRPNIRVIVVDNDPESRSIELCRSLAPDLRWPVTATTEPRRGIPFARNTALKVAGTDVDFVAFVDDDEVPDPHWLDELLHVQRQFDADVVSGPVLPYFPAPVPNWVIQGGFFNRKRYPTGTRRPFAATNNVIIRSEVVRALGPTFNEKMALTGGTDTHYFMRVARAGYSIVWADTAIVHEWIPASRANARWLLQRAFRKGNCLSICDRELGERVGRRMMRGVEGLGRVVYGVGALVLAFVPRASRFKVRVVRALGQIWRGVGTLAGLVGYGFEEYRRVHQV